MKNVRAEGEVTVLAHRLAAREREVEQLQARVTRLEALLEARAPCNGDVAPAVHHCEVPASPTTSQPAAPQPPSIAPAPPASAPSPPHSPPRPQAPLRPASPPTQPATSHPAAPEAVTPRQESSLAMSPPPPPTTVPPPLPPVPAPSTPAVNLIPPTPETSQGVPATHLLVPAPLPPPPRTPSPSRSRSPSPAPDISDLRRSPRLAQSPAPHPQAKRPADEPVEEQVTKKRKQE